MIWKKTARAYLPADGKTKETNRLCPNLGITENFICCRIILLAVMTVSIDSKFLYSFLRLSLLLNN